MSSDRPAEGARGFGGGAGEVCHGFPLKAVSWGYREQFRRLLEALHKRGLLEGGRNGAEPVFAPFLRAGLPAGWEHVLKEFLGALDGGAGWLVRAPALLRQWRELGLELAKHKIYLGARYFALWAAGGLVESPEEARLVLARAARLAQTDPALAVDFLSGYPEVRRLLSPGELGEFVENGLSVFRRDRRSGQAYFQMKLRSAQTFAQRLSRSCRLEDVRERLGRLFRAVAGRGIRIDSLSRLDSDDLLLRRSGVVCGGGALFLPERVAFGEPALNRSYYLAATLLAAACYRFGGFCAVHGEGGVRCVSEVLAERGFPLPEAGGFLFQAAEVYRLKRRLCGRHPGAAPLVDHVCRAEARSRVLDGVGEQLLALAVGAIRPEEAGPEARAMFSMLVELVSGCDGHECVLGRLCERWAELAVGLRGGPHELLAPPLSFFPDHDFPLELSPAPPRALAADRARAGGSDGSHARDGRREGVRASSWQGRSGSGEGVAEPQGAAREAGGPSVPVGYLYDEWNGLAGEYYREWCCLREVRPQEGSAPAEGDGEEFRRAVERVKRLFQRLKPEQAVREKYLYSGDYIDLDALVRFVTVRKARGHARERFWIKPRLNRRDVAVALLLDVSGSTGERHGEKDVIAMEKQAAGVLAAGLDELGDRFAIYGFTGSGREDCIFFVFKDFDEDWTARARRRLRGARPGTSTRMGVALRHAGTRLAAQPARTKLIILITDGKPMDSDYDPRTRYAHYDVRRACLENEEAGVHTFCIGLDPEAAEGLEIMFPRRRYAVLRGVRELPEALSRAYLRLTRA